MRATQKALDDICRAALAVPTEKLAWTPGGEARSALAQMQEVASSATWVLNIATERKPPVFDEHALREAKRVQASYDTLEKCIAAAQSSTGALCQAIAQFPDRDLDEEIQLPFGGGVIMTMADVLGMHQWNLVYHLGQINQIQLMLGDRQMH